MVYNFCFRQHFFLVMKVWGLLANFTASIHLPCKEAAADLEESSGQFLTPCFEPIPPLLPTLSVPAALDTLVPGHTPGPAPPITMPG